MATIETEIDRLFPKCRVRSPKPETGILIDLGDENQNPMDTIQSQPCHRESDSDDLQVPLHSVPSYPFAQRVLPAKMRGCDSTEQRRKLPRPRTLDLYESQGAGYEPSPDSEDNDSDFAYKVSSKKLGFRTSASESHISNKWRKQEVKPKRSSKEIYDVNPSRHDGCSTGESRMEIAGGREVLSRSRARTQRKRQSLHVSNSSASTKVRTVNRYSGEVYYEESVGRYGFHVDGSTLWGSQGLEPSFSIPSSLSEKATPSHSVKRPLSWSGDGVSPTGQSGDSKTGLSEMPQILDYSPGEHAEENRSTNVLQGYLTDFYPELLNNEVNGTDGRSGSTLNLDNYSLEQLNQFAQSRKELGGGHEDNCASLATVIGGLTIAQYEGSPRRYGPRSAVYDSEEGKVTNSKADITASTGPPRPGFPRRVTTFDPTDSKSEPTFSPSVTRQALVHMSQGLPDTPSTQMSLSIKDLSPLCVRNDLNAYKAEDSRLFLGPVKDEGDRDTTSTNAETDLGETEVGQVVGQSRNFTLSPETTDCDSDLEEPGEKAPLILPESPTSSQSSKLRTTCVSYKFNSMPVLEDGLSSGRNSDDETELIDPLQSAAHSNRPMKTMLGLPLHNETTKIKNMNNGMGPMPSVRNAVQLKPRHVSNAAQSQQHLSMIKTPNSGLETEALDPSRTAGETPPPPAPLVHRPGHFANSARDLTGFIAPETSPQSCHFNSNQKASEKRNSDIATTAPKERGYTSRSRKTISLPLSNAMQRGSSPVWVPRQNCESWSHITSIRSRPKSQSNREEGDDEEKKETDQLLDDTSREDHGFYDEKDENHTQTKKKGRGKEVIVHEPAVLIEGVLFRASYLGSTQIVCEGKPTKVTRMMQAEEAVSRIKAPDGETQPTTEVDLFISTEKIMVLNTELKEIMMDHSLRTISYIADIGDLVVIMARRRLVTQDGEDSAPGIAKIPKMICHVFESEEAQFIAQSIGQAFQVAYMEFLKANGIEDQSFVREMDYQEVLNSQEIFSDEIQMFAKKELQKEVIVPKARNEILGVVIVESGWGSMLPTVVIANLAPAGAAARCGQLNIGDQIIAINGVSLVGLPLSTCQTYIKNAKSATVVKLTVVPCPPVVEVKIKRPDTKYQLGFSVQNGVICSLLRGGIAERGGVRVGHRIIEINGQSVVAVPHERIVGLLATSVGEIHMKTMPTSMFRLLTGQETPLYI